MSLGIIHSYESFATLDGGGIRFCVFMQGCPLRCVYCHNPDSQDFGSGNAVTTDELSNIIHKKRNFYLKGGVTFSGGEPLCQAEFLVDAAFAVKQKSALHIAIDTSLAVLPPNFDEVIDVTDLFIVDLKFSTDEGYMKYCGGSRDTVLEGLARIDSAGKDIWLRTVIVPGINDSEGQLDSYIDLAARYKNIKKYQLLAYHDMARDKYHAMGRIYPMGDTKAMDKTRLKELQNYVDNHQKLL